MLIGSILLVLLAQIEGKGRESVALTEVAEALGYPEVPLCSTNKTDLSFFLRKSFLIGDTKDYYHQDHVQYVNAFVHCTLENVDSKRDMKFCLSHLEDNTTATICVPKDCEEQNAFNMALNENYTGSEFKAECTLAQREKQWYQKSLPLFDFSMQLAMFTIVITAGLFDWMKRKGKITWNSNSLWQFGMTFSGYDNMKKLASTPPKGVSIECLYGVRVISMIWTVVGHSYMFQAPFISNLKDLQNAMNGPFFVQIITNFTLSVDSFFLLSGCLTAYAWFRHQNNTKPANQTQWNSWKEWGKFYRHRLIRLLPAYVYVLIELIVRYGDISAQPLWPLMNPAVQCSKYWWQNALFLNSIYPNRCMPWMWYLADDFIYFCFSPIFLLLLRDLPKLGLSLIFGVVFGSSIIRGAIAYVLDYPPIHMLWHQPGQYNPDVLGYHINLYIKPYTRVGPYMIGLLLGYFLISYAHKLPNGLSARFRLVCWSTFTCTGLWSVFGAYSALNGYKSPVYDLLFVSTYRTIFAISVAWVITVCYFDGASWFNRALSCKPFVVLGNLSYSVYLFHVCSLNSYYFWGTFPIRWKGHLRHAVILIFQLLFVYGAGFLLHMSVEAPCLKMEKEFLFKKTPRKKKTSKEESSPVAKGNEKGEEMVNLNGIESLGASHPPPTSSPLPAPTFECDNGFLHSP